MAAISASRAAILLKTCLKQGKPGLILARSATYWNKDWKPGPYPTTPEERAAAAKKYGLIPEDYEPYPDVGHSYGDYPKLPEVSIESRDPHYDWDLKHYKRNFGEPLHVEYDMMTEDRYNFNARPPVSYNVQMVVFLAVFLGGYGVFELFEYMNWKSIKPLMPKQYPSPGVTHYTFEPASN